MQLTDEEFEEMLALCKQDEIPADRAEARRLLQNFCDLVELLACHPLARGAKEVTNPPEDAPEGSLQTP